MVSGLLGSLANLDVVLYNARTTSRTYAGATGETITIGRERILPERTALLLPGSAAGNMLTSPGPPTMTDGAGLYAWDETTTKPPFTHEVGAGINTFPVIYDASSIGVFTV